MHGLADWRHLGPEYVVSGRAVADLEPVPLAPLLVQQLLELLVRHELLVPVQDGDVEVGVHVALVGARLQERLHLVLGGAPVQEALGELLAALGDVHVLAGEVLDLGGVDPGLARVLEALLERVVLVHVLGGLEDDALVDGAGARLEQLDALEVVLVYSPVGVGAQPVSVGIEHGQALPVLLQSRVDHAVRVQLHALPHPVAVLLVPCQQDLHPCEFFLFENP